MTTSLPPPVASGVEVDPAEIAAVRRFNRFHTRLVGALDERMLASDFALPQLRVLYEIAHAPAGQAPAARDLAAALRVDPGYLSRVIGGLESDGLVERRPSAGNAKRLELCLTPRGSEVFAGLDAASAAEVAALLGPLVPADRRAVTGAMETVRRLLGDGPVERTVVLRDPEPGDLGTIVARNGALYAAEYGWDQSYEALVAEIVAGFVRSFDPGCERLWMAEVEGRVAGSVMVIRGPAEGTARLRLLWVEPWARGLGIGRRLVEECLRFATARGYRRIELWTNDCLVSARRIYQGAGFELVDEAAHHSFGRDLVGQTWARAL
ncbi:bifunctional helix-turn-helix transcriptional regulator/GNAT family N-acetyltransferase [Frigidibacter sp. MR17.24]|uniref:bifunctional helix-turn-helix transcriptional regulator/GNAT family N-acetyltransferase n=1 Tax=Frigidibacter sp. MR17.24 TaxID=3127345 RepID=UPI003012D9BD